MSRQETADFTKDSTTSRLYDVQTAVGHLARAERDAARLGAVVVCSVLKRATDAKVNTGVGNATWQARAAAFREAIEEAEALAVQMAAAKELRQEAQGFWEAKDLVSRLRLISADSRGAVAALREDVPHGVRPCRPAARLLVVAVKLLPPASRDRWLEELSAELIEFSEQAPSWASQIRHGLRVLARTPALRRALHATPRATRTGPWG